MDRNELRLGNLLMFRNERIAEVSNLGDHFATIHPKLGYLIGSDDFREYEPIQITEEWLLKFGFVELYKSDFAVLFEHHTQFQFKYKFNLKTKGQWFEYYGGAIKCDYVHSLQNLYIALTGEELTVKL